MHWMDSASRRVFQNYTNPMPQESALEVLHLVDEGRVTVVKGTVEETTEGFRVNGARIALTAAG